MSHVDLGFHEECEPWRLESPKFPSKIGGKPAWLSYKHLPSAEDLKCPICSNPKRFLCQVYAPFEECDQNFHRTVFIFVCKNTSCRKDNDNSNFSAYRSNLPRRNEFYSFEPRDENFPTPFDVSKWVKLCALCGCAADKSCSRCKTTPYCSREHQVLHWKVEHKKTCGTNPSSSNNGSNNELHLFPEYELSIEPEELDEEQEVDLEAQLKACAELQTDSTLVNASEGDLDQHAAIDGDETFTRFRKRIESNISQVLRYERSGMPLWVAAEPLPKEIPNCECGSPRMFEFQVMPQMLVPVKDHDLDYGVLAVYTCAKSCWEPEGYKKEFIFKQDVAD